MTERSIEYTSRRKDADHIVQSVQAKRSAGAIFRFTASPTVNILNGNRFMTTSREGNINEEEHGLFRDDTRFLSTFDVRINDVELTPLSSNNTTHYSAMFYLTNPEFLTKSGSETVSKESLVIHRKRFIEEDVREEFFIKNVSNDQVTFTLTFQLAADFADLFEIKSKVFGNKPDLLQKEAQSGQEEGERRRFERRRQIVTTFLVEDNAVDFRWTDEKVNFRAETIVWFSKRGQFQSGNTMNFEVVLEPKQTFRTTIVILLLMGSEKKRRRYTDQYFERQEKKIERILENWNMSFPRLDSDWDDLKHSYYQSLIDLLFLSMPDPTGKRGWTLLAAGCPWFMTLFGRDTLITSYQTIFLGPNLAKGAIAGLAECQAKEINDNRDEQPGKIIHELRYGDYAARTGRFPYYGTADATPLFLVLFSEIYRWTGDSEFASTYRKNAMDAIKWIDEYGDFDHDGFVEYFKRSKDGLVNQCWKDSWNSIQFSNGRIAETPIAACEIQGYVYDAKVRLSEIAREVWKDSSLAKKLLDEANDLKRLFNEKFWMEDRGYYAIALDKEKKQVDAMTSNNGHLFWSGIVDDDKVDCVFEKLIDKDSMFSGYGIRTMSTKDRGYDPIGYHTGCVWAHDNSIIAHGFERYGRTKGVSQIASGIIDASPYFGYTLPETFAGLPRPETGFPVRYPTSCSPQAWAAGAPLLLLRSLLGISPSRDRRSIEVNPPILREHGTNIRLQGISAFGKKFDVEIVDGSKVQVYESGK